jgi:hypothetical protein
MVSCAWWILSLRCFAGMPNPWGRIAAASPAAVTTNSRSAGDTRLSRAAVDSVNPAQSYPQASTSQSEGSPLNRPFSRSDDVDMSN